MIHFTCALKCEASPLIDYYQLKHVQESDIFNIYVDSHQTTSLTITGIGKLAAAAAAATAYSFSLLNCKQDDVWINMGIAGHVSHKIGDIFLANRVEDAGNGQVWYPQLVIDTDLPSVGLLTLDKPSTSYIDQLYDMEAAGFMYSTCRFTSTELTQCIKIVSDNQDSSLSNLSASMTTELIERSKDKIVKLASQLQVLRSELNSTLDTSDDFRLFSNQWHFTQYQQTLLKKLLRRWHLLQPESPAIHYIDTSCSKAKTVLTQLETKMDDISFYLTRNNV